MKAAKTGMKINSESLTGFINELKNLYEVEKVDENRKKQLIARVNKYGYFPYPHVKVLKELSEAETIITLEEKLKLNSTYRENRFTFDENSLSPLQRAKFQNSEWFKKEQHNIKLINLAGLGNGNSTKEPGKFIDWLKQLVTLPAGKPEEGILSATVYLIPFHPREFGCAYIPKHSGVSPGLEDEVLRQKFNLDAKDQVKLFISLCQLAGHPVIYDVLPQTGRFSGLILSNPYAARWFNIKQLINQLTEEVSRIKEELKEQNHPQQVDFAADIIIKTLSGENLPIPDDVKEIFDSFENRLLLQKKKLSDQMMKRENQLLLHKKAREIINGILGKSENEQISEEDISDEKHGEIIGALICQGLWPAGGGAWNSAGTPVFDKMSEGGGYPTFKHYDYEGNDVTHFANLDCQTPYYFVNLENGKYNEEVIEFFIDFLKKLRNEYNFDGYRVDHLDHITDRVSEENDVPISYRAPRLVLRRMNEELKKDVPYFSTLAEYMLWDNMFKQYHHDMKFDILWGNDIISQYQKNVSQIIQDNARLEEYNKTYGQERKLSILKVYNNQDGEFRDINQYPGQLGESGAIFKWFKLKFIPGGTWAQRPVMFIDGDESFTKLGIEEVIGEEKSMTREDHSEFFHKFDAINRFALNNRILEKGKARLYFENNTTGFVSWLVELECQREKLFITANQRPPQEYTRIKDGQELNELTYIENYPLESVAIELPEGFSMISEFIYNRQTKTFEETDKIINLIEGTLHYENLKPSEFHIYKIT